MFSTIDIVLLVPQSCRRCVFHHPRCSPLREKSLNNYLSRIYVDLSTVVGRVHSIWSPSPMVNSELVKIVDTWMVRRFGPNFVSRQGILLNPCSFWRYSKDRDLHAFQTRMTFGLCNRAQTFQRFIHSVLRNLDFSFIYWRYILSTSSTGPEHLAHLQAIPSPLSAYNHTQTICKQPKAFRCERRSKILKNF